MQSFRFKTLILHILTLIKQLSLNRLFLIRSKNANSSIMENQTHYYSQQRLIITSISISALMIIALNLFVFFTH